MDDYFVDQQETMRALMDTVSMKAYRRRIIPTGDFVYKFKYSSPPCNYHEAVFRFSVKDGYVQVDQDWHDNNLRCWELLAEILKKSGFKVSPLNRIVRIGAEL